MASGELVYLPVLNFLQFSRNNGVDDDLIIRHALEFFDAAAVVAAKSAFWNKVLRGEICPIRAGNKATQSHLRAILELLAKCDSEDLTVPKYVILSANEVPSVPDLMFSHLSSKHTVHEWKKLLMLLRLVQKFMITIFRPFLNLLNQMS